MWPAGRSAAAGRGACLSGCVPQPTVGVKVMLTAATPRVASTVYAPLGFQASPGALRMVRSPRVMTTAAQPASVPQHLP